MAYTAVSTLLTNARYGLVDPNSSNFADAELIYYLNQGKNVVWNMLATYAPNLIEEDPVTGTITSESYEVTLETVPLRLIDVRLDGEAVPRLDLNVIYDWDDTGKPRGYYMRGFTKVLFYPQPSNDSYAYSIRMVKQPVAMASDGYSPLPQMFDDLLVEYVTIRAGIRDEAVMNDEASLFQSWKEQLMTLISNFGYEEGVIQGYYPITEVNDDYGYIS